MTLSELDQLRQEAAILHQSQTTTANGPPPASFDAIFTVLAVRARGKPGRKPVERTPPPEWFQDALHRLAGQRVTASSFLVLSGHMPVTDEDRRSVGRWLRDAGKTPRKIGGQLMFQL